MSLLPESILLRCKNIAEERNVSEQDFSTQWLSILEEAIEQEKATVFKIILDRKLRKDVTLGYAAKFIKRVKS